MKKQKVVTLSFRFEETLARNLKAFSAETKRSQNDIVTGEIKALLRRRGIDPSKMPIIERQKTE